MIRSSPGAHTASRIACRPLLHRPVADQRVDRVNRRREFCYATPGQVLDALREHKIAIIE